MKLLKERNKKVEVIPKENEEGYINKSLLNVISPVGGLIFERNKMFLGENMAQIYGITKYSSTVDIGWLSKISNVPGVITCQYFEPTVTGGEFLGRLSKSITENSIIADSAREPIDRIRADKKVKDAERMIKQIDENGESVGNLSVLMMAIGKDEKELEKGRRNIESVVKRQRCNMRLLSSLQKEAFQSISPYWDMQPMVDQLTKRLMPLSTFLGGFPFSSNGFSDPDGYYFARDTAGGLIILDPWRRGGDRNNSNFVIMGESGIGKSTVVKNLIYTEITTGTKVIIIDPEAEYLDITKVVGGEIIDCGGGGSGRINPLQIRPAPIENEDEDEEDSSGMGDMALHFNSLQIFFDTYLPSLEEMKKTLLKIALEELYAKFGITWDTNIKGIKNTDFPVFADLHSLLEEKYKEEKTEDYKYLSVLIRELAHGADSFLFNGHTTIDTKSDCICLNTSSLQNASDTVKKTQYFNLLNWSWEQIAKDRNQKVLLICDEAYLMIDPSVPQTLRFLRNAVKRARKYSAGIAVVSHSVVDFLDPRVKLYGQAILDSAGYTILMGCAGKNLEETKEVYKLTENEEALLYSKKRGHGLLKIGSKRLYVKFEIPEHRLITFGKAGGK